MRSRRNRRMYGERMENGKENKDDKIIITTNVLLRFRPSLYACMRLYAFVRLCLCV